MQRVDAAGCSDKCFRSGSRRYRISSRCCAAIFAMYQRRERKGGIKAVTGKANTCRRSLNKREQTREKHDRNISRGTSGIVSSASGEFRNSASIKSYTALFRVVEVFRVSISQPGSSYPKFFRTRGAKEYLMFRWDYTS